MSETALDGRRLMLTWREGPEDDEGEEGILIRPRSFFLALIAVEGRKIF